MNLFQFSQNPRPTVCEKRPVGFTSAGVNTPVTKIASPHLRIGPLDKNESLTSRDSKSYEYSLRRYIPYLTSCGFGGPR